MQSAGFRPFAGAAGAAPSSMTASRPIRIQPNRRQVDNRFPVLGFTVTTGGLPYYEVLLTTDPRLFAPDNAGRRNASNFYASRQDSGLIRVEDDNSIYLVPQAVLRSFAAVEPKPTAIYYTLIAYATPEGGGARFAHDTETLPEKAPSVAISGDFNGHTLGTVLGVPLEKLRSVGATGTHRRPSMIVENGADEGEDAYSAKERLELEEPEDAGAPRGAGAVQAGLGGNDDEDDDFFDLEEGEDATAAAASDLDLAVEPYDDGDIDTGLTGGAEEPDQDFVYEDGYENEDAARAQAAAGSYSDEADLGAAELGAEPDEDFVYNDGFEDEPGGFAAAASLEPVPEYDDSERDEGRAGSTATAAESYGEEFDELDDLDLRSSQSYQSLDLPIARPVNGGGGTLTLTDEAKRHIIEKIIKFEAGAARYGAMNLDGEFKGRFGKNHAAYNTYHIGLSYGIVQFTQDSGNLGKLLALMQKRDPDRFAEVFGADADELVRVTNASGPPSRKTSSGRSARVQPVARADLWEEPWTERFREAAKHAPFQGAQNQLASELFLDRMLPFCAWLGLDTERAITMVVDRAVQMGVGGARRFVINAVGPIKTEAQREQVLRGLGHDSLRDFQDATEGLASDGEWGPQSHAAMVAALRGLGDAAPLQVPNREEMLDKMVSAAAGRRWAHRPEKLRDSVELSDVPFDI